VSDGQEIPCPGVYREIIPNQKLVFTDAYSGDWMPKTGGKWHDCFMKRGNRRPDE
jgi:uncharacterized protein YndB with AHSA1/START domain